MAIEIPIQKQAIEVIAHLDRLMPSLQLSRAELSLFCLRLLQFEN